MTVTIAATTASTPAVAAMMTFRRFPRRPPLGCSDPTAAIGAVEGSDAYHGPDDLLPPESLVTHATVPTGGLTAQTALFRPGRLHLGPGPWRGPYRDLPDD